MPIFEVPVGELTDKKFLSASVGLRGCAKALIEVNSIYKRGESFDSQCSLWALAQLHKTK